MIAASKIPVVSHVHSRRIFHQPALILPGQHRHSGRRLLPSQGTFLIDPHFMFHVSRFTSHGLPGWKP